MCLQRALPQWQMLMERSPSNIIRWLFDSQHGPKNRLLPRWIFLRALSVIYFSAFFSLLFQIRGLIGPRGILPAQTYLAAVDQHLGRLRIWYAPTLFWLSSGSHMLMAVTWIGLAASVVALFNSWPRLCFVICFVCYVSFVSAAGDFSGYQSDGMLLEAGFLALFFAPGGLRPRWGAKSLPLRAALFLLQWEWFRIYFESGMVKLLSGDEEWRTLTAMDEYYQNGPLPTWIGWYVQHLPHWFHVATAAGTLVMELGIVWMLFLPRRVRLICFFIVTPWEIAVIVTANYTFLNYLVLALGFLLLDDRSIRWLVPRRWQGILPEEDIAAPVETPETSEPALSILTASDDAPPKRALPRRGLGTHLRAMGLAATAVMLTWIAYDTTAEMVRMPFRDLPLPSGPVLALEPFRIANQYGLFAVMTRGRYEIEFQGSNDGTTWTPYPFRYKPQALNEAPRIYAPYQPRFDWNLWFASLGDWQQNQIVPLTEEQLLLDSPDVLALFRSNSFAQARPRYVRAVLWQYWFTTMAEKKTTGNWWRRELIGLYAPVLTRTAEGKFAVAQWPEALPQHN
jgi:hypothetical protein